MVDQLTPTIYVVDDDEMVRDSLKALLESHHFRVHDFDSAAAFLNHADSTRRACLVLDIHMPGMTGLELLRILRQRSRAIPTILITGRTDSAARAQAHALGAIALLDKPLAYPELFSAIEQALGLTCRDMAQ
jgi:FixJ family two-component response regulator